MVLSVIWLKKKKKERKVIIHSRVKAMSQETTLGRFTIVLGGHVHVAAALVLKKMASHGLHGARRLPCV